MAPPDINTLPTSPRTERPPQASSTNASRRASQIMPPPTHPASASASTSAVSHSPQMTRSPTMSSSEQLPMRHPRPLTAVELMLECEKEQEAVVNRLTRELTALRAQSASVASNASSVSSTSAAASLLPVDINDTNPTHQIVGATHPTPSRRHRTSSSASARSFSTNMSTAGSTISSQAQPGGSSSVPHGGISQASADRAAAATGDRSSLSRNPSVSASGTSTPARQSMDIPRSGSNYYTLPHRPSLSRDPSQATISSTHAQPGTPAPPGPAALPSPAQSPSMSYAMQHIADTTAYRTEMEIVKAENEVLRQRVRALERALRTRRDSSQSDATRPDLHNTSGSRENLARLPEAATEREREARPSREFNRIPSFTSPPPSAGLGVWDGGIGGVAGPRERSESQSTTASSRRAVGVNEEELRLGESASSTGVTRGN